MKQAIDLAALLVLLNIQTSSSDPPRTISYQGVLKTAEGEIVPDGNYAITFGLYDQEGALLWDARYSLITVALAGFGRAIAEVGAVMIVGGNIDHLTRVMTTAIALETSKGDLALALALGIVLLAISMTVNALALSMRATAARQAYA